MLAQNLQMQVLNSFRNGFFYLKNWAACPHIPPHVFQPHYFLSSDCPAFVKDFSADKVHSEVCRLLTLGTADGLGVQIRST